MSQGTKHSCSEHVNMVLNKEYYITRKRKKKMHFKYWGKYVKRAWQNHGIFRRSEGKLYYPGSDEWVGVFSSLSECWGQSFRDLEFCLTSVIPSLFNILALTEKDNIYEALRGK